MVASLPTAPPPSGGGRTQSLPVGLPVNISRQQHVLRGGLFVGAFHETVVLSCVKMLFTPPVVAWNRLRNGKKGDPQKDSLGAGRKTRYRTEGRAGRQTAVSPGRPLTPRASVVYSVHQQVS